MSVFASLFFKNHPLDQKIVFTAWYQIL